MLLQPTTPAKPTTPKQPPPPPMDPPQLPPLPTSTAAATATAIHLNYADSVDSSPRSRAADPHDELLPPVPGAKLRLMCSYGGHIMPRPHDKSLCYVGGETRIVAFDRHSSLSALSSRLSRTLLGGRSFTLKYQLPNEDLDSLVSVSTDEDLENMIEEHDRLASSGSSVRIRLFLFFNKPETTASMGTLLADSKSETWFVDALNGSGLVPRNLSDSAAIDTLLNIDSDAEAHAGDTEEDFSEQGKTNATTHEVQTSISESLGVENTTSSFGSSSSSSMANLPPIRVRVEDSGGMVQEQRMGIEEQFAQMSFGVSAAMVHPAGGSSENLGRVLSDDERSDHGVPAGFRKPPLPLQQASQYKPAAAYANLPSPDSVASDSSIASANSVSKMVYYHDQAQVASRDFRTPPIPSNNTDAFTHPQIQVQQAQDSGFAMPSQSDPHLQQHQQQQFMHTSLHYIPHPAPSAVPLQSYYPVYATPTQQQYPLYMMPVTQPGQYMSMQPSVAEAGSMVSSHQLPPPNSTMVNTSAAYKEVPPLYPAKTAAPPKPEMGAAVYGTAATSAPQMVQVPSNQFQHQYPGFSVMHHPSQAVAAASAAGANYTYEYANAAPDQVYYAQHQAVPLPPQYQTMTPAAAVAALADASKQLQTESGMPQVRTSQPQ